MDDHTWGIAFLSFAIGYIVGFVFSYLWVTFS